MMALSAGGTFLESREANKNAKRAQSAKDNAFQIGMNKQRQFADESGAAFGSNINNQSRQSFDQNSNVEGDRLKQAFGNIQTQPDYNSGTLASTPNNVMQSRKESVNKSDQQTARDLTGLSALNGTQGALFEQDLSRGRFGRLFGNIQDKASAQSRLLPLEMEAASTNAMKAPSLFPTLLKLAGTAGSIASAGSGITSFGDKVVQGPLPRGGMGPGAPMKSPGLFSTAGKSFRGIYGG